jgi:hypothetical protein
MPPALAYPRADVRARRPCRAPRRSLRRTRPHDTDPRLVRSRFIASPRALRQRPVRSCPNARARDRSAPPGQFRRSDAPHTRRSHAAGPARSRARPGAGTWRDHHALRRRVGPCEPRRGVAFRRCPAPAGVSRVGKPCAVDEDPVGMCSRRPRPRRYHNFPRAVGCPRRRATSTHRRSEP